MKDKGQGWILNIASIESTTPYPSAPAYATSKWGLRGWSKSCFIVSSLFLHDSFGSWSQTRHWQVWAKGSSCCIDQADPYEQWWIEGLTCHVKHARCKQCSWTCCSLQQWADTHLSGTNMNQVVMTWREILSASNMHIGFCFLVNCTCQFRSNFVIWFFKQWLIYSMFCNISLLHVQVGRMLTSSKALIAGFARRRCEGDHGESSAS